VLNLRVLVRSLVERLSGWAAIVIPPFCCVVSLLAYVDPMLNDSLRFGYLRKREENCAQSVRTLDSTVDVLEIL